jgi:hypothetical protein
MESSNSTLLSVVDLLDQGKVSSGLDISAVDVSVRVWCVASVWGLTLRAACVVIEHLGETLQHVRVTTLCFETP